MKKKLGIILISIMAIAAFALAGCGNGSSSSGASSQPAPSGGSKASLHIVVDYADQNSEYKNIEVKLDGESLGVLKDYSRFDGKYDLDCGKHTVTIINSDTSSQIGETAIQLDKNLTVTFTIKKDSVDYVMSEN